jgi:hypothetical protein
MKQRGRWAAKDGERWTERQAFQSVALKSEGKCALGECGSRAITGLGNCDRS